jgi:Fe-S-cluster-containing hydrogenase component 2
MPPGTTAIEQRTIASHVPVWEASNCTQCNICAFVCPHAAIRPVLATPEELAAAPAGFNTLPIKGAKDLAGYQYRVQVSQPRAVLKQCTTPNVCVVPCIRIQQLLAGYQHHVQVRSVAFCVEACVCVLVSVLATWCQANSTMCRWAVPHFVFRPVCASMYPIGCWQATSDACR